MSSSSASYGSEGDSSYTIWLNQRFGNNNTRSNTTIYDPFVQNFTSVKRQYNDGTIEPPMVVLDNMNDSFSIQQPEINQWIDPISYIYSLIDTNPNYKSGGYFPDYTRITAYYDLPEGPTDARSQAPARLRPIPLDVRRQTLYG